MLPFHGRRGVREPSNTSTEYRRIKHARPTDVVNCVMNSREQINGLLGNCVQAVIVRAEPSFFLYNQNRSHSRTGLFLNNAMIQHVLTFLRYQTTFCITNFIRFWTSSEFTSILNQTLGSQMKEPVSGQAFLSEIKMFWCASQNVQRCTLFRRGQGVTHHHTQHAVMGVSRCGVSWFL